MAPKHPTIMLFDIDGTLVTTAGAGRRAINRAFQDFCGASGACDAIRFDGMTDPAILRLGLRALGRSVDESAMQAILATYLPALAREVEASDGASYRAHVGVVAALEAAREAGAALGLGTGNIEAGAKIKLERVGLMGYFSFGGYGSDSESRPELIRRGAERGAQRLGVPLASCRVVVIGDTPKDVAAARAMSAESIGVATGSFGTQALLDAGATHAFPNLAADGALSALIDGA